MAPWSSVMSDNACGLRMSWTYRWAVIMPQINIRGDRVSCRLVDAIGSTRNGRRDIKCSLDWLLGMVREDTGIRSEGAACVWTMANEAVGFTNVCRMM
ncbi:hypothetical protein TNCV_3923161 [Trichonephila clavipes]|nr:hypothetical protein TNCV_3923161 [Trichonephila clavipes]